MLMTAGEGLTPPTAWPTARRSLQATPSSDDTDIVCAWAAVQEASRAANLCMAH